MQNLKIVRMNYGKKQADVALALNMPVTTYASYEQEKSEPTVATLISIADYFGCSIDYLLGHQTKNTLQLEGLNEAQRKIVELVIQLTPEQSWFVLGKVSDVLGLPYNAVKPVRPY